jgi:hypothetical protein
MNIEEYARGKLICSFFAGEVRRFLMLAGSWDEMGR